MHSSKLFFIVVIAIVQKFAFAGPQDWKSEWPNTDFNKSTVNYSEIISGGPPKDGIPAIDHPRHHAVSSVIGRFSDKEPVIVVRKNDETKAYPLSILMWHEIVNDVIGKIPITVTYCPLCNSAVVFDRRIHHEKVKVLDFGVSGKLRNSDMIMYDRQTESWWQQFTGEGIVGELTGVVLDRIPSKIIPFSRLVDAYPEAKVLIPVNDRFRNYGENPYVGYDQSASPFLYAGQYNGPGSPLSYVVAVENEAWLLDDVRAAGMLQHGVLRISWQYGMNSVLDAREIEKSRDIGFVNVQRKQADGHYIDAEHTITFAFAFKAFYPDGTIYAVK